MAKKEEKISFRSMLNQFMQKSLQSLVSVVAEHADHLVDWVKSIPAIKRKIRKLLTALVLFSAGLGVIGIGIGLYLASLYPQLSNGISHILVGLAFILTAIIYTKITGDLN